jgi:hypothetical protein
MARSRYPVGLVFLTACVPLSEYDGLENRRPTSMRVPSGTTVDVKSAELRPFFFNLGRRIIRDIFLTARCTPPEERTENAY